ncbi:unnamed protein product [Lupinus luteus]|uniref:Uncharacterized protein n=1 Tax=Lupinus luteus TaxID=3873 RepID=A0AAV1Y4K2_LUPLU
MASILDVFEEDTTRRNLILLLSPSIFVQDLAHEIKACKWVVYHQAKLDQLLVTRSYKIDLVSNSYQHNNDES